MVVVPHSGLPCISKFPASFVAKSQRLSHSRRSTSARSMDGDVAVEIGGTLSFPCVKSVGSGNGKAGVKASR